MNWRPIAATALLVLGVLLPLPLLIYQSPASFGVVVLSLMLPIVGWGIILWFKGGWFNFSPLINPIADRKHHRFFSLTITSAIALEWSLIAESLFSYIAPNFLLPTSFGPFPNPLIYLNQLSPNLVPPGVIFAVVFVIGYLFVGRRQHSVKRAGLWLVYPSILAGFIPLMLFIISAVAPAGLIPSIAAVVLYVILLVGVPFWLRAKKLANWFLTIEMMAYVVGGFIFLNSFESNIIPNGVALAANVIVLALAISLAHFEEICRQEHHIVDSLNSLGKLRRIGYLTILVALFGIFFLSLDVALYGSVQLAPYSLPSAIMLFASTTNIYFPLIFFVAVVLWSFVTVLGNKVAQPVSYALLLVFFFLGAFFLAIQSFPGVWNLGPSNSMDLAVLSLAIFYEPAIIFVSRNYVRLPKELSINYWAGRSKLLHSRYKPIAEVGAGGFARVVKVTDEQSGREVALKQAIAKIDRANPPAEEELKRIIESAVDKIDFEHVVLSNCHFPLIVGFIDYFQEGSPTSQTDQSEMTFLQNQFLAEEFVDGVSLESLKGSGVRLTEAQVRHYLQRILLALNYLHQHDMLHRDLTTGNVLIVRQTNDIKIIDFGLAKKTHGGLAIGFATKGGSVFGGGQTGAVGTEGYYAPELLSALDTTSGIEIDERYDIYSAGALGFFLATLTSPPNLQDLTKSRYPSMDLPPMIETPLRKLGFSAEFIEIIKKAMAFDRKDRYASAFEFYAALAGLKGDFLVTDVGEFYRLDRAKDYDIHYRQYNMDRSGRYDFEQGIGKETTSPDIVLRTSKAAGTLGKLAFDAVQGTFRLVANSGMRYYTSPKSSQSKPLEHTGFFLLRNGVNVFVSYKTIGLIKLLSRNYVPEGVFRYYGVA